MKTLTLLFLFVAAQCFGQPLLHSYATTNALQVNNITYYVAPAPLGSDSNNGLTAITPFLSVAMAESLAQPGNTIHLLDGTNQIASALIPTFPLNLLICLSNGVNWVSEPNAWLVVSNDNQGVGSTSYGVFCPFGNNIINGLNILCNDTNNSECLIGRGTVAVTTTQPFAGMTNIVFNNLNVITYGTGIHYENINNQTTNLLQVTFNNPHILANRAPIVLRGWKNCQIVISGGDITTTNFNNNNVVNTKPFTGIDAETTLGQSNISHASLVCNAVSFHISDVDQSASNRSACLVWDTTTTKTNNICLNGCSFEWNSITNPLSMDFSNTVANALQVTACSRNDGSNFVVASTAAPNFGNQVLGNLISQNNIIIIGTNYGNYGVFTNLQGNGVGITNINLLKSISGANITPTYTQNSDGTTNAALTISGTLPNGVLPPNVLTNASTVPWTNNVSINVISNTAAIGTISNITPANATFFTNNLKSRVQLVGTIILVAGQTALGSASANAQYNPTVGGTLLTQNFQTLLTFAIAATNQQSVVVSDILGPGDYFQINTSTTGNGSSVSFQNFHFKAF